MITLEALNALSAPQFIATLGGVFEHSPWVPQRVAVLRPFASPTQLLQAMRAAVRSGRGRAHRIVHVQVLRR